MCFNQSRKRSHRLRNSSLLSVAWNGVLCVVQQTNVCAFAILTVERPSPGSGAAATSAAWTRKSLSSPPGTRQSAFSSITRGIHDPRIRRPDSCHLQRVVARYISALSCRLINRSDVETGCIKALGNSHSSVAHPDHIEARHRPLRQDFISDGCGTRCKNFTHQPVKWMLATGIDKAIRLVLVQALLNNTCIKRKLHLLQKKILAALG
ncbi:hypothetical protein C8F01DRAFT_689848 [Mycena amicta]|nr:hypothetical protein C8F01DRAFT_689848 [Mycena amicta]